MSQSSDECTLCLVLPSGTGIFHGKKLRLVLVGNLLTLLLLLWLTASIHVGESSFTAATLVKKKDVLFATIKFMDACWLLSRLRILAVRANSEPNQDTPGMVQRKGKDLTLIICSAAQVNTTCCFFPCCLHGGDDHRFSSHMEWVSLGSLLMIVETKVTDVNSFCFSWEQAALLLSCICLLVNFD